MSKDVGAEISRLETQVAARPSLTGAKIFAGLVFAILGASFVASPVLLYLEFRDHGWGTLALTHSHLFLFFPTFGLLALLAFHLPSAVFVHLYWHTVPWGKVRFIHGCVWAIGLAFFASYVLLGEYATPRHVWEIAPSTLAADQGEPVRCDEGRTTCRRVPVLDAIKNLRDSATTSVPLSKLGRACAAAILIEPSEDFGKERYCVPAGRKLTGAQCCDVQMATRAFVSQKFADRTPRSQLAHAEVILQGLKSFFIVVLMVIAILLLVWRVRIQRLYPDLARRIDWQVMIGACALLLWPIMDYAFQDAANALFGRFDDGIQLRLSLVVGPWLAVILYYFLQRFHRRVEVLGQILGVAGGLLAFFARDELRDLATKMTGVGMPSWMFPIFAVALIVGFSAVLAPRRWVPNGWRQ
jgi:hypothetical protein